MQIELLLKLLEVCDKYNLKCFVSHGTLLGAVRHRGFIPWDDDIDVNMPRKDFEMLKKVAKKEFTSPYFFQHYESDPEIFSGIAKLRMDNGVGMDIQDIGRSCHNGMYIDIFTMDGIVEDETLRKKQSKKIEFYRGMLSAKVYGKDYIRFQHYDEKVWKRYKLFSKFVPAKMLFSKFEFWCSKYTGSEAIREGIISFKTDYECCYWYKEDYEELTYLEFEGLQVPVPQNYERCLKIKWNNYMEFPSLKDRGYKHKDVILEPETSYSSYDITKFQIDFKKLREQKKKVILFGAGAVAEEYLKYYGKKLLVSKIIDNDVAKQGGSFCGIEVFSPEILRNSSQKEEMLIIASSFFKEIEKQVQELGWNNYFVYLPGRKYK